jgi:hypothetical protein
MGATRMNSGGQLSNIGYADSPFVHCDLPAGRIRHSAPLRVDALRFTRRDDCCERRNNGRSRKGTDAG